MTFKENHAFLKLKVDGERLRMDESFARKSSQPIRVEYDFRQMMTDGARFWSKGSLTRS